MRQLLCLIILAALNIRCDEATSHLSEQKAQQIILPITNSSIDFEEVKTFSQLAIPEMIRFMRDKYHIKVLVLDYADDYPQTLYPALITLNDPADADAFVYYTKQAKDQQHDHEASFIEAYNMMANVPESETDRPLLKENMIILHRNVDANMITHEFIHFLISRSTQRTKIVDKQNRSARVKMFKEADLKQQAAIAAVKKYQTDLEALKKGELSEKEFRDTVATFITARAQSIYALAAHNDASAGEEMDIARLMYDHQAELYQGKGMSLDDYKKVLCLGYYHDNFKVWIKEVGYEFKMLNELADAFIRLDQRNLVSEGAKKTMLSLIDAYRPRKALAESATSWIAETIKLQ